MIAACHDSYCIVRRRRKCRVSRIFLSGPAQCFHGTEIRFILRVRLSLGLKPLQVEKTADKERAAHAAVMAAKAEEQRKAEEAALAEHIRE